MLTLQRLQELLSYEPITGKFTWLVQQGRRISKGSIAGSITNLGYCSIKIDGRPYQAHRLAWLYMYGVWPTHFIDHIDGIRSNNKPDNLREATHTQNTHNTEKRVNNTSGFKGVTQIPNGKFVAKIGINSRTQNLGTYATAELASEAYEKTAKNLHGVYYRVMP